MKRVFVLDLDDTLAYTTRDLQGDPARIPELEPVEGALKFLQIHSGNCILLTAGIAKDQRRKIKVLGIESYFNKIYVVSKPEEKQQKLEEIVNSIRATMSHKFSRIDIVVIGDRLDTELRTGKRLKCATVRIKIPGGRHSYDLPKHPFDHADFEATNFDELMKKWGFFRKHDWFFRY